MTSNAHLPTTSSPARSAATKITSTNAFPQRISTECPLSHNNQNNNGDDHSTDDRRALCRSCSQNHLRAARERLMEAQIQNNEARRDCERVFSTSSGSAELLRWLHETRKERENLEKLQNESSRLAVLVAAKHAENDQRRHDLIHSNTSQQQKQQITPAAVSNGRNWLASFRTQLHDAALPAALERAQCNVAHLRWNWVIYMMESHGLVVEAMENNSGQSSPRSTRRPRGVGKIGGLPLPHAGPDLYTVLPKQELTSALRLVASLTTTIAMCLGIDLPHPILLRHCDDIFTTSSSGGGGGGRMGANTNARLVDIADLAKNNANSSSDTVLLQTPVPRTHQHHQQQKHRLSSNSGRATSLAPTVVQRSLDTAASISSMGQAMAKFAFSKVMIGTKNDAGVDGMHRSTSSNRAPKNESMPKLRRPQQKAALAYAVSTVICESNNSDNKRSTERYVLGTQNVADESFTIGLQLLGHNILTLCMQAGVHVDELWPPEALLLNLHALREYCYWQLVDDDEAIADGGGKGNA